MKSAYDVIIRPVITEQSMEDLDIKKYAFEVAKDATKIEIEEGGGRDLRRHGRQGDHHRTSSGKAEAHRPLHRPALRRSWKKAVVAV